MSKRKIFALILLLSFITLSSCALFDSIMPGDETEDDQNTINNNEPRIIPPKAKPLIKNNIFFEIMVDNTAYIIKTIINRYSFVVYLVKKTLSKKGTKDNDVIIIITILSEEPIPNACAKLIKKKNI